MFLRSNLLQKDFEIAEGKTSIGRAPDCTVTLEANQVSKHHLELKREGDRVWVRDEQSRNNSRLNQREIRGAGWAELHAGDVVEICGIDFQLMVANESDGVSGFCVVKQGADDSQFQNPGSRVIPLSERHLEDSDQFTQLRALLAITGTLRDVLQTEDVLERAVAMLFQILPHIDRAAICFLNEDKVVEPKWWQVREGQSDSTIRVSQHIGRLVAESSEAMITYDAMADFEEAKSVQISEMRSVMCCPLVDADGNVFGIIHVDSDKPNRFGDLDLEVLAAVAMQIALAINCSRLHAVAVADELLRQDIKRAHEVQQRYLPSHSPTIEGFDVAGFYRAAREVGGDYFDYVSLPDGRLAVALGDVVGKGVPAALTMVRLATETRAGLEVCRTPSDLLTRLNQRLQDDFITLVVMILNPDTGEITLSNAGHEPPLLRKSDGAVAPIGFDLSACPVGVLEDEQYRDSQLQLNSGERLLVYSDGFPDAEHQPSGRRFGSDAISQALAVVEGTSCQIIERLVDQVDRFAEDSPQFDDMCMVCIHRD